MGILGTYFSQKKLSKFDPSEAKQDLIFPESKPSSAWQILSFQIHQDVKKKAPNTLAISVDLDRLQSTSDGNLHKPFKIKDLGLLTYISRKSASRRFSWCNSQLLTTSGSRAMKETLFVPYPTTPGNNRLRSFLALHGDRQIILV